MLKSTVILAFAFVASLGCQAHATEQQPDFLTKVQLFNFDGFEPTPDGAGVTCYRLPLETMRSLSAEGARQMTHARFGEIRFVLNPGAKLEDVKIHLTSNRNTMVMYYRGDVLSGCIAGLPAGKGAEVYVPPSQRSVQTGRDGDKACVATLQPAKLHTPAAAEARGEATVRIFPEQVHRIQLHGGVITLTGIEGDIRAPKAEELPPVLLSYGTSISMGAAASRPDRTFTALTAAELGFCLRNLGCSGNAFCERETADYLARQPAGLVLLEISVNMIGAGTSAEEFGKRATYLIDTIAKTNPTVPVVCISILTYGADRNAAKAASATAYRETLEKVCKGVGHANVHFIDGSKLLSLEGLSKDDIHPTDQGMAEIAAKLVPQIRQILVK